jgi:hypothetical protein
MFALFRSGLGPVFPLAGLSGTIFTAKDLPGAFTNEESIATLIATY